MKNLYKLLLLFLLGIMSTAQAQCGKVNLPYAENFNSTPKGRIPNCTTMQNLGYGNEWSVSLDGDQGINKVLTYTYDSDSPANVWFFTRKFKLKKGVTYTLKYDYRADISGTFEKMKVAVGDNDKANAMTKVLADHSYIDNEEFITNKIQFTVDETKVYCVGFQAYSDADQYYLNLDNISLEEGTGVAQCSPVSEFSYSFEAFSKFPQKCWSTNANSSKISIVKNQGSKTLQVFAYLASTVGEEDYIVTPEVNNLDGTHVLSFAVRDIVKDSKYPRAQFGMLKAKGDYTSFMPVGAEFEIKENKTYTSEPIYDGSGEYKHLVLKVVLNEAYQTAYLDDFVWKVNPNPCPSVSTLPYDIDFQDIEVGKLPECTKVRNEIQGSSEWEVVEKDSNKSLRYKYDENNDANSWFFTRGLELKKGETYLLKYAYKAEESGSPEKMKVAIGESNNISAMTKELADHVSITNTDYENNKVRFAVDEDKTYYIGFKANSEKAQFYLYLDNIKVEEEPIYLTVKNDDYPEIIEENGTLQLVANVSDSYSAETIVWTVESGDDLASVDANGLVTATQGMGKVVIKAALSSNPSKYAEKAVYVCTPQLEYSFNFDDFTEFPTMDKFWKASKEAPHIVLKEQGQDKYVLVSDYLKATDDFIIVTPTIENGGNNKFSFDTKEITGNVKVQLGMLKDSNSYDSFTSVGDEITLEANKTYTSDAFPQMAGYKFVAMKFKFDNTYQSAAIDNVEWKEVDPCPALELPYSENFESTEEGKIPECTTVENGGPGTQEWEVYDDGLNKSLRYRYDSNHKANVWFFTRKLQLKAGDKYLLSYDYKAKDSSKPEKMKVAIGMGNMISAMTKELADHVNIINTDYVTNEIRFSVDADGEYNIGFKAKSEANKFDLFLDNIEVKESPIYLSVKNDAYPEIIEENGTLQLVAEVSNSYSSDNVIWTIESGSELGSVDQNGVVTATQGMGKMVVRATLSSDASKYSEKEVYVCTPQAELSFDFNDFTEFPDASRCWKASQADPLITLRENSGNKYILINKSYVDDTDFYIVTPTIENGGDNKFSFDTKELNGNIKVQLGMLKDSNSYDTFTSVGDEIELEANKTYTSDKFPEMAGYKFVAMKFTINNYHNSVNIDNISWKEDTMGTNDLEVSKLSIYPNPVDDVLTISTDSNVDKYEVVNISGQVVLSGKGNTVNMAGLSKGIYLLKVQLEGNVMLVKKVIKK